MNETANIEGIVGQYVNDSMGVGTSKFEELSRKERRFDSEPRESAPLVFSGIEVDRVDKVFVFRLVKSILKLNQLPSEATFILFQSLIIQLAWLTNCSPDMVAEINLIP